MNLYHFSTKRNPKLLFVLWCMKQRLSSFVIPKQITTTKFILVASWNIGQKYDGFKKGNTWNLHIRLHSLQNNISSFIHLSTWWSFNFHVSWIGLKLGIQIKNSYHINECQVFWQTYLFIVQILFKPSQQVSWRLCVPIRNIVSNSRERPADHRDKEDIFISYYFIHTLCT